MNTLELSSVAEVIRHQRELLGHNQAVFAKALGVSSSQISVLENLSINKVTPAIYNSFLTIGIDLKELVPSLIVEKLRGKDRLFKSDINISLKKKDPIKLLEQARDLIKNANTIINNKISNFDSDIEKHKGDIKILEEEKKNILSKRDNILTQILDVK